MASIRRYQSLDVGTTKTSSTIVEVDERGEVTVLGHASVPSQGLRNSLVINIEKTTASIHEADEKARRIAGVEVGEVVIGVAGDHIRSFANKGVVSIARDPDAVGQPGVVTESDLARVQDDARSIAIPMNQRILHVIDQDYKVDDQTNIIDPLNLSCRRLEVNVLIITCLETAIRDLERCVERAGLRVKSLVLESIASGSAVLTEEERQQGCLLIDIGGGTLDVAIYHEGSIRATTEVRYAGETITADISQMFKIPAKAAEKAKVDFGGVIIPDTGTSRQVPVRMEGYDDDRYIDEGDLNQIIRARVSEVLKMVQAKINRLERSHSISSVVLTGGGSQLRDIDLLSRDVFGLPTRIGIPTGFRGFEEKAAQPSAATAVGLILYQIGKESAKIHEVDEGLTFTGFGRGFKKLFKWLFKD